MSEPPAIFAYPEGRQLDTQSGPPNRFGRIGVLANADPELVELARRHVPEIPDREIEQHGKVLVDRRDGSEYEAVTALVDWVGNPDVHAFSVRDGLLVPLRVRGTPAKVDTVVLGTMRQVVR